MQAWVIQEPTLAFSVEVHCDTNAVRVVVGGDLDIATAPYLRSALERVLDYGRWPVLLDLSGLEFVDCGGWRVIDNAASTTERRGGRLEVEDVSPPVDRFMEVSGDLGLDPGFNQRSSRAS